MTKLIAPTPPMGWNSWNTFGESVNEEVVRETVDAMEATGLREAGYQYVNIDDFWQETDRKDGLLRWNECKFPGGMPSLARYVHQHGMKFGLYSCAGTLTCGGLPGSYGREVEDARAFASWGVDFLKYDYCYLPPGVDSRLLFFRMGHALRATGRDILYSVCEWGRNDPWDWAAAAGAQTWRVAGDIDDHWDSIVKNGFERLSGLTAYSGPGRWNDPDMLVVGMHGTGNAEVVNGTGCTDAEYRSHFLFWCLAPAPLIIGADVRELDSGALALLASPGAIAINQDPLGIPARRIGEAEYANEFAQVWSRPLAGGRYAVGLFNMGNRNGRRVSVAWETLGIDPRQVFRVRDALTGEALGEFNGEYTARLDSHDSILVTLE